MKIPVQGYDDPETRRAAALARWRRGRRAMVSGVLLAWDAYGVARETAAKAIKAGVAVDLARAEKDAARDHLAACVLVVNGHGASVETAPHTGFHPNMVTIGDFDLIVVPGDDDDPRRALLILTIDE